MSSSGTSAPGPAVLGLMPVPALKLRLMLAGAAVGAIVGQQASPLHLPGHRGLIWLTALVAVRAAAGTAGWASGVGAASSALALLIGPASTVAAETYLLAGVALDAALVAFPAVGRRAASMAVLAAIVHLSGLIGLAVGGVGNGPRGEHGVIVLIGAHLAFGAAAGATGFLLARGPRGRRREGTRAGRG